MWKCLKEFWPSNSRKSDIKSINDKTKKDQIVNERNTYFPNIDYNLANKIPIVETEQDL